MQPLRGIPLRVGIGAGFAKETIEAIRCNRLLLFDDERRRIAYKFLVEVPDDKRITERTSADAIGQLGDQGPHWILRHGRYDDRRD